MSKKYPVCRLDLGFTRVAGFCLYCEQSREFQETTPKDVKDLIKQGQVNGLKLVNGEIELDTEGFNLNNLMVKSAVGKFRPLYSTDSMINCMYTVVRVIETDKGRLYETISNKCARVKISEEKLKILMQIGYVAGVKMVDGEIIICNGVTIQDKRTQTEHMEDLDGVNLETKQNITHDNPADTVAESVRNESNSNLEVIFDSIDVHEVPTVENVASENTYDDLSKEKDNEKLLASSRKNRKKATT